MGYHLLRGQILNPLAVFKGAGATPKITAAAITAWQASGDVIVGGLPSAVWNNATASSAISITMIAPTKGIRCNSTVQSIIVGVNARTGAAWKLKQFRYDGTDYNYIGGAAFTPAATGNQTFTGLSLAAQVQDTIGVWHPATGNTIKMDNQASSHTIKYATGDIVADNAFASGGTAQNEIEVRGTRPYLAIVGDSIAEGSLKYNSYLDTSDYGAVLPGPSSAVGASITYELAYQIRQLISGISIVNVAVKNYKFANVVSTTLAAALAHNPAAILVHCGINDVQGGTTWATVLGHLNTIKATVGASVKLYIDEILPWTAGTDQQAATIRLWNTNLAAWCTANGAFLVSCHDTLGQTRASTGQLDDLKTEYNLDDVHLTEAGAAALAQCFATRVS